ncbi:MAG TPA: hypothetical protein VIW45_19200, partial [Vicinamibacterales bacterium]
MTMPFKSLLMIASSLDWTMAARRCAATEANGCAALSVVGTGESSDNGFAQPEDYTRARELLRNRTESRANAQSWVLAINSRARPNLSKVIVASLLMPLLDGMKRRYRIILAIVAVTIVALAIGVASTVPVSSEAAREKVIAVLAQKFDADVELGSLRLRVLPTLHAEGDDLVIRHKGRRDVPPLITVRHFSADSSALSLYRKHLSTVRLEGLDIQIPPDHKRDRREGVATTGEVGRAAVRAFVIDHLQSVGGRLVILRSQPEKPPRVWDIHRLRMQFVSFDRAMPFDATLTNAIPPGEITTQGRFGPWRSLHPGDTPLDGDFTFEKADLGVFEGISGILSAKGTFGGKLERIDIHGDTVTPEF